MYGQEPIVPIEQISLLIPNTESPVETLINQPTIESVTQPVEKPVNPLPMKNENEVLDIKFDERLEALPPAKIWGQHFFRDQSISLFTRSRDVKALDSYIIGIGDEILVTVWGRTDYSANVLVDEGGYINLSNPLKGTHIPRLYVKGLSFAQTKKALIERLANHMNLINSQYSVELNYSRSINVNITGDVFNPGSWSDSCYKYGLNALVASGGPSQIGSVRKIKILSSERPEKILDVYEFINNPNVKDEFFLSNNDYIYVPLAGRVVEISESWNVLIFAELLKERILSR